jgi:hypothetical protein
MKTPEIRGDLAVLHKLGLTRLLRGLVLSLY